MCSKPPPIPILLFLFRVMAVCTDIVAASLALLVSNLTNFSSWPKHHYSLHLGDITCISMSRLVNSMFVAAETWWCPCSCSWAWLGLARFALPVFHLPRRQHHSLNQQEINHSLFFDSSASLRARGEHERWAGGAGWAATIVTASRQHTEGVPNSEISALKHKWHYGIALLLHSDKFL